ncbi:MAG: phosphoglucosamine mutase [Coriobacteriia bacterium]|nr:phosphoglucosamine mutase [Coriobacteriia bacterium]
MNRHFGTDGVRGVAYSELTVQMAEALGFAAVTILGPRLLIGRDTRFSGPDLQLGLVRGISAAGGQALLAEIIPTPAIAFLVREYGVDGGVVISASHNPPEHNGIKFFNSSGYKLSDAQENLFEAALQNMVALDQSVLVDDERTTTGVADTNSELLIEASERYIAHAVQVFAEQGYDLKGLKIVVDCAHGAACQTSPETLKRLGADVIAINAGHDGYDINVNCGSTDIKQLQEAVMTNAADLGIAHDGDADRLIIVDSEGSEIDGDYIKAICAKHLKEQNRLVGDTVVSTVMANLGFIRALEAMGINVVQTDVGDSKVLAAMLEGGYVLGGEQSGHIIFLEHNSTGDGLVSALQLLVAMRYFDQPLYQLKQIMKKYPQVMINVEVSDKARVMASVRLITAVRAVEAELGNSGRVLLRPSGTEPKIRVMVEAQEQETAQNSAEKLASLVDEIQKEVSASVE